MKNQKESDRVSVIALKLLVGDNDFEWSRQPPNIAHFLGESGPSYNTLFLGPTRVSPPNATLISWAILAGLTNVTSTQYNAV